MTPLRAIRLAMMSGVLLFGGVSWFITKSPDWEAPDPEVIDQLTNVARIAWIAVGIALVVMYAKFRNTGDASRASTVSILAWALGEMLALFGGVVLFMTAFPGWYVAGLMALALSFVAFPPPASR